MTTRTWLDTTDNWTTAADWSGGVAPGASDDAIVQQGGDPQVTSVIAVRSIADYGQIDFVSAGSSSVSGDVTVAVAGVLGVDGKLGNGGSGLSVGGTLTNKGTLTLGNTTASAGTTVSAASMVNYGTLSLNSGSSTFTTLTVQATAGFGTAGTLSGSVTLSGNSVVRFASGTIRTIAPDATLNLIGPNAFVENAPGSPSNSALTGLTTISAGGIFRVRQGASVATSGSLTNYGFVRVDSFSGDGGSALTVGSILTNHGNILIGNDSTSTNSVLTARSLKNDGTISLTGSGSHLAFLDLRTSGASFGTANTITGNVSLTNNSLIEIASGSFTTIGTGAILYLDGSNARVATAAATTTNSALTGLKQNNGAFELGGGASVAVTGSFTNAGVVLLGDLSTSDAHLSIASTFTNKGDLYIEDFSQDATAPIVLDALRLVNTGTITLGDNFTANPTTTAIKVASAAGFGTTGVFTGSAEIDAGGLIQFASGQIYDLKGSLTIGGGYIALAGNTVTNSALTRVRQNYGTFNVTYTGNVNTSSSFANSGTMSVDHGGTFFTSGTLTNSGSLTIGSNDYYFESNVFAKSLRNSGQISIIGGLDGPSDNTRPTLTVNGAAGTGTTGVLTGTVTLTDNSRLRFQSGQITTIEGSLSLSTADARVVLTGNEAFSSALTGLKEVRGKLSLDKGATISTSGTLKNTGTMSVDASYIKIGNNNGAVLDNEGTLTIGNDTLAVSSLVLAGSITNHGIINISGNGTNRARLDLSLSGTSAGFGTVGVATGTINLSGNSAILFANGQIQTIDRGASIDLDGGEAVIALASSDSSNSALTGLSSIDGTLRLENGELLSLGQDVTVGPESAAGAFLSIDQTGAGGSTVGVSGAIINQGNVEIGNSAMTSGDFVAVDSFTNNGNLTLQGGNSGGADLDIGSAAGFGAAGELSGNVSLIGNSVISFMSGSIDTIDANASLTLDGADAHIANQSDASANSALLGLTENDGTFSWLDGAFVRTNGSLTNYGTMQEDKTGVGGSQLLVNSRLDNESSFYIGNSMMSFSDNVSAASLVNNRSMTLTGNGAAHAQLNVAGTTTNNGTMTFVGDVQDFTGAVNGFGKMLIQAGTTLEFDSSVASSQEVDYGGADELALGSAKTFAAPIKGFAATDTIDLKSFAANSTLSYAGNSSAGVLSVTNGANVAHLNFLGSYTTASFSGATDGAGGLLISHT